MKKKCCAKRKDPVNAAIARVIAMRSGKMAPPRAESTTWVRPAGTLAIPN